MFDLYQSDYRSVLKDKRTVINAKDKRSTICSRRLGSSKERKIDEALLP